MSFVNVKVLLKILNSSEESIVSVEPVERKHLNVHFKDDPEIIPIPPRSTWTRIKTASIYFFKGIRASICFPCTEAIHFCCDCGIRRSNPGTRIVTTKSVLARLTTRSQNY